MENADTIMSKKLSPVSEVVASHIAATTAAFQTLVLCLEANGALHQGQMVDALKAYMETVKSRNGNEVELALLHDLRQSLIR